MRLLLPALLFIACTAPVTRSDWQQMTADEKTLYVNSLLGAEKARERKGGERAIDAAPADVIARIDAAYAAGDGRNPEEIFNTLVARPDSPPRPAPASP